MTIQAKKTSEHRDLMEAYTSFACAVAVEAGAGTGKTAVLVARVVAWCLGPGWARAKERLSAEEAGDTVRVGIRVTEGQRTRTQVFEGVVIRNRGSGPGASFTVRRISHEVGVERTFLLHSPSVEAVQVIRRGAVRRARLYYLRGLSGRAARIKEARRV